MLSYTYSDVNAQHGSAMPEIQDEEEAKSSPTDQTAGQNTGTSATKLGKGVNS